MGAKPHPRPSAPQPVAVLGRRPQIARSMRLRLALRVATLLPALTGGAQLAAQEPSPYVPIGHWATPYLEHLIRSEEHTSELQSRLHLVCRLLLEKKKKYYMTSLLFL